MMTAEKWHEYQGNYERYGFDMKPAASRQAGKTQDPVITLRDKAGMVLVLILAGLLCVCLIVSTAYSAGVKYEINSITAENELLQGEIENLNVQLKNATNIRTVEHKALNELGMVYPVSDQFVFLARHEKPQGDFAMLIKEHAYND